MNPILLFVCFLAGMVLVGKIVALVNGTKARYFETFPLAEGERVLWQDLAADAYPLATARARWTTFLRRRRQAVRVTSLRIISAEKGLFGPRHVVQHVLYASDRPYPGEADTITGGYWKYGYRVLVFDRLRAVAHDAEKPPYFELPLKQTIQSSTGLESYLIYSDALESFRLPE